MRKYTDKQYEEFEYFQDDDEVTKYEQKLVVTRKEHTCSNFFSEPVHIISIKSKAIVEKAFHTELGRVSNYICLDCADKFFEQVPNEFR